MKENNKPFIDQVADFYISTVDEAHSSSAGLHGGRSKAVQDEI